MLKRFSLVLSGLLAVICTLPLSVSAENPTRLSLVAAPLQDEQLLVVDVLVEDVVDLYGAEVQLRYDPTQLRVQDANPRLEGVQVAPGTLLSANERFVVNNNVDTETGLISFAATLLNPAPPVSGDGILATVAFEIVGGEPNTIEFVKVQLVSSDLVSLDVTTQDLEIAAGGGIPTTAAPVGWPSWALGLVILAAVLLALFVAITLIRARGATTQPASPPVRQSIQPSTPSAAKSSITLTEQGNRAVERGDLRLAHEFFSRAVEQDPSNANAWLGKGLVADLPTEKRICFQRVLALDPDNTVARAELKQLTDTA
jgi:hypothetical protein